MENSTAQMTILSAPPASGTTFHDLLRQPTARFLRNSDELWMVYLPLVWMALGAYFWVSGEFGVQWRLTDIARVITSLVFLDGVHVALTFVSLLMVPELRGWTATLKPDSHGWARGIGFWGKCLLMGVAITALVCVLRAYPTTAAIRGFASVWLLLEILGPAQHTAAQFKGISLCYNSSIRRTCRLSEEEKSEGVRNETLERKLQDILNWGKIIWFIPTISALDSYRVPFSYELQVVGAAMVLVSCAGIIINAYFFPRHEESRKFAFSLRALLHPLHLVTAWGNIGLRAAHGTEYLAITRRMVQGSKISNARRTRIYLMMVLACAVWAVPFLVGFPGALRDLGAGRMPGWALTGSLVFTTLIRYLHFHIDAVMYRMSDPQTRAVMGPLLTSVPPPPGFGEAPTAEEAVAQLAQLAPREAEAHPESIAQAS